MGKKKPFIKKGEGVKFYLVHRSQKDPLYLADNLGEHVLMPADPELAAETGLLSKLNSNHAPKKGEDKEKRLQEQQKYGIYYDDDYDYLQHLKEVNNNEDEDESEDNLVKVGSVLIKTNFDTDNQTLPNKPSKLVLPSTVFASKFEEEVGYFNQAAPDHDPKINWDPDIVRFLDEDTEIDPGDDGDLEDDFFIRANQEGSGRSKEPNNNEEDQDEDEDNLSNVADDDYSDMDSESKSVREFENKSRFSQYSMSSSVIRRNEGLRMLDEQFEKLFAQYDDDQVGALDTEDIEGYRAQDEVLNAALEEFSKLMEKKCLVTEKDTRGKKLATVHEKNEESDEEEEDQVGDEDESTDSSSDSDSGSELVRFNRKREKEDRLDCESIISTYSTIYNHPATIKSDDDGHQIRISKKSGLPLGVLKEKEKSKREIEHLEHKIVRVLPELPLKRDPNESKEEKKERKQMIKAHRRERRVEKKINKMAFKEEKKTQVGLIKNSINNKNIVKLPL